MLPPPGTVGNVLKRKTLQERAAEPLRPAPHPPGSRPNHAVPSASSLAGLSRQTSTSSTSTRPSSSASSYRHPSTSSYTTNHSRGPSGPLHRPHSSMSNASTAVNPPGSRNPSASTRGSYARNGPPPPQSHGDSGSMDPFSFSARKFASSYSSYSHENLRGPVLHGRRPSNRAYAEAASPQPRGKSLRDISLNSMMGGLSLSQTPSLPPPVPLRNGICRESSPSQIPKKKPSASSICESAATSPLRTPQRTIMTTGGFLTRDSNTRDVDWQLQDRLDHVEHEMNEFRKTAIAAQTESLAQKDTLELYKARGTDLPSSLTSGELAELGDSDRARGRESPTQLDYFGPRMEHWPVKNRVGGFTDA